MEWPDDLIRIIARNRCVLFLGAGVSMNSRSDDNSRPPSWKEFLSTGGAFLQGVEKDQVDKAIANNNLLLACELIRRFLGIDKFIKLLRDQFVNKGFREAAIHNHLFDLRSRIVITPNFDKLYDTLASTKSRGKILVKNYKDSDIAALIRGEESFILKNHGTIDSPREIIFTQSDYARARIKNSDFYQIIEALILTHTFIFIGAGLNDPDIRLLFENYATTFDQSKNHYFVIAEGELTEDEMNIYKDTMHLEFVTFDSHDNFIELTQGIQQLVSLVEEEREVVRNGGLW